MTKVSYEATIGVLVPGDGGAITFEVSDAAGYGAGTAVAGQIAARRDLQYTADDGTGNVATFYIPYHAIAFVVVSKNAATVEAPEDEFCNED